MRALCETNPIFYQKSPIFCQKNPTFYEASPVFYEKSPTFDQKRPMLYEKSLHVPVRTQPSYTNVKNTINSALCILSKEPYILSK